MKGSPGIANVRGSLRAVHPLPRSTCPARSVLELHASSIIEAIKEIVHSKPKKELPTDAQTILRALTERAEQMTNYLGKGVAVPHARMDGIDKPTLAFGRSEEGVETRSLTGYNPPNSARL